MIKQNKERLAALAPFDRVYCSGLKRTQETAFLHGYADAIRDPLLDELDFGRFEGAFRHDFLTEMGPAWLNSPETLTLGESVLDFEKRVRRFLHARAGCQAVLVFAHGAWCRAVKSIHETGGIRCLNQTSVKNNEILVFDFQWGTLPSP